MGLSLLVLYNVIFFLRSSLQQQLQLVIGPFAAVPVVFERMIQSEPLRT